MRNQIAAEQTDADPLWETYHQCLSAYLKRLGSGTELPEYHPLTCPTKNFYTEDGLCSAIPFTVLRPGRNPEQTRTKQLPLENFPFYLGTVCQLPDRDSCKKEREALYHSLADLIEGQTLDELAEQQVEILKKSKLVYSVLDQQWSRPFVYLCENGNLMLDVSSVDEMINSGAEKPKTRHHLRWDRFQPLMNHLEEWSACRIEDREGSEAYAPDELLKAYFTLLSQWEGQRPPQWQRYHNCFVQRVAPDGSREGQMLPFAQVNGSEVCPLVRRITLPGNAVLYQTAAEQFASVVYEPACDAFRVTKEAPFYLVLPQREEEKPSFFAVYDLKAMPEQIFAESKGPSAAVKAFFHAVCGNRPALIREFALFFARIMTQDEAGITIIYSSQHRELIAQTLFQIFRSCAVGTEGLPKYRSKFQKNTGLEGIEEPELETVQVTVNQMVKPQYLKTALFAQQVGRSLVFLDDRELPASQRAENRFAALLKGGRRKLLSETLPAQQYRNRLHAVCVTDRREFVGWFRQRDGAFLLDFTGTESGHPERIVFSQEDLHWFRTAFLLYGLKLRTLLSAGQNLPQNAPGEERMEALFREMEEIHFLE